MPSESLLKDILFEWESTARGHCTWEREGIFVISSFTGTREDQYSDEAHFHLDCKVNSQDLRLWSLEKSDVVAEVGTVLLRQKQNLVHEQQGRHRPYSSKILFAL